MCSVFWKQNGFKSPKQERSLRQLGGSLWGRCGGRQRSWGGAPGPPTPVDLVGGQAQPGADRRVAGGPAAGGEWRERSSPGPESWEAATGPIRHQVRPASPATTVITQTASNPLQGLDRQSSWGSVLPLQQENRMVRALQEVMGILTVRIRLVIHGAFSFTDAISLSHHHGL